MNQEPTAIDHLVERERDGSDFANHVYIAGKGWVRKPPSSTRREEELEDAREDARWEVAQEREECE